MSKKQTFYVEATETLIRSVTVKVKAKSKEEAEAKVLDKLENFKVNFDNSDFEGDFDTRVIKD